MMKAREMGTALPVATSSDHFELIVAGQDDEPSLREKAAPTGEATYTSGCTLRKYGKDKSGNVRVKTDKTASVNVLDPATVYELGKIYRGEGRIWVMPYESNTRVALSITVERLVPVEVEGAAKSSMGESKPTDEPKSAESNAAESKAASGAKAAAGKSEAA